jgi:excisionase family DNA binding protein
MDVELPDTISIDTIKRARTAIECLRAMLTVGALPDGLTPDSVHALLTITEGVAEAAAEDHTDLSPSEAADRLGLARPSVMRLIARGDLSSRKDGGHYVVSPREVRAFQVRLATIRQEAMSDLTGMAEEFIF